jgi:biotin carboxyl carrier protein
LSEKFKLDLHEFDKLSAILNKDKPQGGFSASEWAEIQSAHVGFEAGLELLGILFLVAAKVKFWEFKVEDDLEVTIPAYLHDVELQNRMKKILVPPPATKADEIVSICGGMYYGQEAPGLPAFVSEGMHFEKGQALYIIEVMKMFNTVRATFSGTIDKIIMQGADGSIVQKGQPLFKITPDEKFVETDPALIAKEKRETTGEYLKAVL